MLMENQCQEHRKCINIIRLLQVYKTSWFELRLILYELSGCWYRRLFTFIKLDRRTLKSPCSLCLEVSKCWPRTVTQKSKIHAASSTGDLDMQYQLLKWLYTLNRNCCDCHWHSLLNMNQLDALLTFDLFQ